MSVKIREAKVSDVEKILELIIDLAVYEKEPDAVKTTREDLIRDGFGEKPRFNCLLAESDRGVIGFALYFFTWSTWEGCSSLYLEDLFVKPEARGLGAGLALFKRLAQITTDKRCKRFEWSVLDWNELAIDFYEGLGANPRRDWIPFRMEGEALKRLAES